MTRCSQNVRTDESPDRAGDAGRPKGRPLPKRTRLVGEAGKEVGVGVGRWALVVGHEAIVTESLDARITETGAVSYALAPAATPSRGHGNPRGGGSVISRR